MPLDPQARELIDRLAALNLPPAHTVSPAEARQMIRDRSAILPREDVASVRDHRVRVDRGEITLRVFTPRVQGPVPALVFFHGGGWVTGDIETHEGICRTLANGARSVVASVDYRLAPEHTFPTAAEDSYSATCWVVEHAAALGVDPRRLAVAGDSAGGNLATVVAMMARDRRGPRLALQVLVYPVTDAGLDTASYHENAEGYTPPPPPMRWYWEQYVPDAGQRSHPYASPLRASDLAGLPPALVITAEYDPLRDEAEAYARRLAEAGVPVTVTRYPGMVHSFFRLTNVLDAARAAVTEVTAALGKAWA